MANEEPNGTDSELVCQSAAVQTNGCHQKTRPSTARMRWKILSNAFNKKSSSDDNLKPQMGSVRRFESFGLIELKAEDCHQNSHENCHQIESTVVADNGEELLDGQWFDCRLWNHWKQTFDGPVVQIRLLSAKIPIQELLDAIDNTGNVCLWPSEEVLSYYCHQNQSLFSNKRVLELGSGMTGLCGLITAVCTTAKEVIITDGNDRSIANVRAIVHRNRHRLQAVVSCRRLLWGEDMHFKDLMNKIDIIFSSDCLYFDESRHLLVDTIHKLLAQSGMAIILAPARGSTFQTFVDLAKEKFEIEVKDNYDSIVYELHKHFAKSADNSHYVPDLHYPVMIRLRHKSLD